MIQFISPFTDSENLYHFTTLDTALGFIIPDSRLRLGSLLNANDPADSKEWFLSFPSCTPFGYDFNYFQDLSLKMKQCIRMACFTFDAKKSIKIILIILVFQTHKCGITMETKIKEFV